MEHKVLPCDRFVSDREQLSHKRHKIIKAFLNSPFVLFVANKVRAELARHVLINEPIPFLHLENAT